MSFVVLQYGDEGIIVKKIYCKIRTQWQAYMQFITLVIIELPKE